MRVLVTGGKGMLGRAIEREFATRGYETFAFGRTELDVTQPAEVRKAIRDRMPDIVVHCAAYTAVDDAEHDTAQAFEVNAVATELLASECQRIGATFVYPSTDYVFSGETDRPWSPSDYPDPVNAYGRSKLAGERAALSCEKALVVRTSWLFGTGGANFVDRITELAQQRAELSVVDDQFGLPTWTAPLASTMADLARVGASGTFHATGGGEGVSWFEFASEIVKCQGLDTRIEPVSSAAVERPARRPRYSVLDCSGTEALLGFKATYWREMLHGYLQTRRAEVSL